MMATADDLTKRIAVLEKQVADLQTTTLKVVRPPKTSEIARFDTVKGQGQLYFYEGSGNERFRFGFGDKGQVFTNGQPSGTALRSIASIQFGVGSTATLTMREQGYTYGNGYIGINTTEPRAAVEIGGEYSPRLSITSNQPNAKRWSLISQPDGAFYLYNEDDRVVGMAINPKGQIGFNTGRPGPQGAAHIVNIFPAQASLIVQNARKQEGYSLVVTDDAKKPVVGLRGDGSIMVAMLGDSGVVPNSLYCSVERSGLAYKDAKGVVKSWPQ